MREIRRRTQVVGAFPDGESALMLTAARLRHVAGTAWGRNIISVWKRSIGSSNGASPSDTDSIIAQAIGEIFVALSKRDDPF